MINKTELRLGNWFQDKFTGDKFRVILISDDIIGFDYETNEKWQAEPIPLTEEILLKCGLYPHDSYFGLGCIDTIYWYDTKTRLLYIEYTDSPHPADANVKYPVSEHIDSLHHLQNVIFDLIGKELEYGNG